MSLAAPIASTAPPAPAWDLSALYQGIDDARLDQDVATVRTNARAFADAYQGTPTQGTPAQGTLETCTAETFARAITEYEALQQTMQRLWAYADLMSAAHASDADIARFAQDIRETLNDVSATLLFFTLEIARLEAGRMDQLYAQDTIARYRPWLEQVRLFAPYQLTAAVEQALHKKSLSANVAWVRLFDEIMADMRLPIAEEKLSLSDAQNLLSDPDPDTRKQAAHAIGKALQTHGRTLALITNTLAQDKASDDGLRGFPTPMSSRNLENQVEDAVTDALISAVTDAYPRLSHRFYRLKASWFGVQSLPYWDRNAPVPDLPEQHFTWDEARDVVLGATRRFEPRMAALAEDFFTRNWIDAEARAGKDAGAFSHPVTPDTHPCILMNFHGKARDVMTLAHELGHGIHQRLAAPLGVLLSDTPLTLAETASVFNEMLAFQAMLETETDPLMRRTILIGKTEDMLNTVVRQVAFHRFEARVHATRRKGEVPFDTLCTMWMDVQKESLGDGVSFDDSYRAYWSYIPHFIHAPFYVYAYAFGNCLVNSLYDVYRNGMENFQDKYIELLQAGGSKRHHELLTPFGLDARDPAFWQRGLSVISDLIDLLEKDSVKESA